MSWPLPYVFAELSVCTKGSGTALVEVAVCGDGGVAFVHARVTVETRLRTECSSELAERVGTCVGTTEREKRREGASSFSATALAMRTEARSTAMLKT
jgi:hypothetical protein